MNKKYLTIIIIAVVLVLVAAASLSLFMSSTLQYKNISLNGISMEVPDNNVTVTQQTDIFSFYNDTDNNIEIFVLDSSDFGLNDFSEAMTFAALREAFQVGAVQQTTDGYNYNYSETNEVYSYVGNYSHKNVLVATKDKDEMLHILETMKVDEEVNINNTDEINVTNESVSKTKSTTNKKTETVKEDSAREDEEVIDGWDPKEHEVYRESMDDGYEKVHYDDGYFRIVDKKGNIETYGY